jgi:hypothetical protein
MGRDHHCVSPARVHSRTRRQRCTGNGRLAVWLLERPGAGTAVDHSGVLSCGRSPSVHERTAVQQRSCRAFGGPRLSSSTFKWHVLLTLNGTADGLLTTTTCNMHAGGHTHPHKRSYSVLYSVNKWCQAIWQFTIQGVRRSKHAMKWSGARYNWLSVVPGPDGFRAPRPLSGSVPSFGFASSSAF